MVDLPDVNDYNAAIQTYTVIQEHGGWGTVPYYGLMRLNDAHPNVINLKERLAITGEYAGDMTSDIFDQDVLMAVMVFQQRHHIKVDGIVGPQTIRTLNVSVEKRLAQLRDAQEEWVKINFEHEKQYIVNIPAQEAYVFYGNMMALDSTAIVGRRDRRTAIFGGEVSYIEINPFWNVPRSIAVRDKLPILKKDPSYAIENKLEIRRNGKLLNPLMINWNLYTGSHFPFQLRQLPNPKNALGAVKIMFPNGYNIYMHDTPSKSLFEKDLRLFSSGCVRLQRPVEFAHVAVEHKMTISELNEAIATGENKRIYTGKDNKVPATIMYLLSWVDKDGVIHFSPDIYGHGGSKSSLD